MVQYKDAGFSLVEQLATIGVVAVLTAAAVPSFSTLIDNNRLTSETHTMRAALANARSEAQAQRAPVTMCRSADGTTCSTGNWGEGFLAFVDLDRDGVLETGDGEQVIVNRRKPNNVVNIQYSRGDDIVRFDSRGNTIGSSGTFVFCDKRGTTKATGLIVSAMGSVRGAVDDDHQTGGGSPGVPQPPPIVDDHTGNDVVCP